MFFFLFISSTLKAAFILLKNTKIKDLFFWICLYELTVRGKTPLRASLIMSAFSVLIVATRTSLRKLLDTLCVVTNLSRRTLLCSRRVTSCSGRICSLPTAIRGTCVKALKIMFDFFFVAGGHCKGLMLQYLPLCSSVVLHHYISSFLIKIPTRKEGEESEGWGERWGWRGSVFSLF